MSTKLAIEGGEPIRTSFLPYGRHLLEPEDVEAVVDALRSDWLTTGPRVDEFEREFASFVGARNAVAVSSGTAALHAAIAALQLESGDEVIVPAMSFVATANSVVFANAMPVFADVDPDTLLISPESVASRVTKRTRAVVGVDYAGQPCDWDALLDIARDRDLLLIDDAAHAVGAVHRAQPIGSLADLTTFSFHPVKHLTTGEGGMVTSNDEVFPDRLRRFRNHGISSDHRDRAKKVTYQYDMVELGYNYRITDFQCALGLSQLRRLPKYLDQRRRLAALYDRALRDLPAYRPLATRPDVQHAYHLYVVRIDPDRLSVDRDMVFAAMRAEGIGVNVHYIPVHLHSFYRDCFDTGPGHCPNAEAAFKQLLTLPLFAAMADVDLEDVVAALARVASRYGR